MSNPLQEKLFWEQVAAMQSESHWDLGIVLLVYVCSKGQNAPLISQGGSEVTYHDISNLVKNVVYFWYLIKDLIHRSADNSWFYFLALVTWSGSDLQRLIPSHMTWYIQWYNRKNQIYLRIYYQWVQKPFSQENPQEGTKREDISKALFTKLSTYSFYHHGRMCYSAKYQPENQFSILKSHNFFSAACHHDILRLVRSASALGILPDEQAIIHKQLHDSQE